MRGSGRAAPSRGEPATKAPHEKEALAGTIDATDRQIDRLVYELYGLTEEEIAVVEGVA
jgi:hypothetical protein